MFKRGKPYLPKLSVLLLIFAAIGAGYSYYAKNNIHSLVSEIQYSRATQYGDNNSMTQTPDAKYGTYELTNLACNTIFTVPTGHWYNGQRMMINIISKEYYTLDFKTAKVYSPINVVMPKSTKPNKLVSLIIYYSASRSRWEVKEVGVE